MQTKFFKKIKLYIVPLLIFILAFVYRAIGAKSAILWVDEFSTLNQAALINKYGINFVTQTDYYIELVKFLPNFIVAMCLRLFGDNMFLIRLPFVVCASVAPVFVYLILKKYTQSLTAIFAAVFTTVSYFLITWSYQLRPYAILELLVVAAIYFYISYLEKRQKSLLALLFLNSILGALTHPLYFVLVICIAAHYILHFKSYKFKENLYLAFGLIFIFIIAILVLWFLTPINLFRYVVPHNNLWYYHSYLWRINGVLFLCGFLGLFIFYKNLKSNTAQLLIMYCILHIVIICFFLAPYVTRYLLTIWPILCIGFAVLLDYFVKGLNVNLRVSRIWFLGVCIFVIGSGGIFVNKPKAFYSINKDFREVALLDYAQVYDQKIKHVAKAQSCAVIDTWPDRAEWYLGQDVPMFQFRWENQDVMREVQYSLKQDGFKYIDHKKGVRLVSSIKDLNNVLSSYKCGYIFIDDDTLPADVIAFVKNNFKKEIYLDHYPLDENPYSIWPATLYSWGLK